MTTRAAYMVVNEKGNPVIWDDRAPIFWKKRWAVAYRDDHNAPNFRVVRIELPKAETR